MIDRAPSVQLTRAELIYLAGRLGGQFLIGIEDPFAGYLADELRARGHEIGSGLAQQNGLELSDGALMREGAVVRLVRACCDPQALLALYQVQPGQAVERRLFYLSPISDIQPESSQVAAVELVCQAETATLKTWASPAQLFNRLVECCGLTGQVAAAGPTLFLSPEAVSEALDSANLPGSGALRQRLGSNHATGQIPAKIVESLKPWRSNTAVIGLRWRETNWETCSLGFLADAHGFWSLRYCPGPDGEQVELAPCSSAAGEGKLHQLLCRLGIVPDMAEGS